MGERPKVVVDVQFQGKHSKDEIIKEQFMFELVGSRIFVRPVARDHPQGSPRQFKSDFPRKRPASPYAEDSYLRSRSPSPKSVNFREQIPKRYRDRSTSPGPPKNVSSERSYERLSKITRERSPHRDMYDEEFCIRSEKPPRTRSPRRQIRRDDSEVSITSNRSSGSVPQWINKENARWNITKREYENPSIDTSHSLGNIKCGAIHYCLQQENTDHPGFSDYYRYRNPRKRRERRNSGVQAGYDEELVLKRLKQFSPKSNESEIYHNDQLKNKSLLKHKPEVSYSDYVKSEEAGRNSSQRQKYPDCTFRCHPCCSKTSKVKETPSVLYEEYEMFASSEIIKSGTSIGKDNEETKKILKNKRDEAEKKTNELAKRIEKKKQDRKGPVSKGSSSEKKNGKENMNKKEKYEEKEGPKVRRPSSGKKVAKKSTNEKAKGEKKDIQGFQFDFDG